MYLKDQQLVSYNTGHIKGLGVIVGVSTTPQPFMGSVYMIQDISGNFPNKAYPFNVISLPETMFSIVAE